MRITEFIHLFLDPINPTETESLIDGFRVSDADLARILLEKADPKFAHPGMIFFEPPSKFSSRFEIGDLHGSRPVWRVTVNWAMPSYRVDASKLPMNMTAHDCEMILPCASIMAKPKFSLT